MVPFWFQIGGMNLTIKGIPPKIHRVLKEHAKQNNRSLNGEVLDILHRTLIPQPVDIQALLREIDEARAQFKGPPLTEAFLRKARNWGRP